LGAHTSLNVLSTPELNSPRSFSPAPWAAASMFFVKVDASETFDDVEVFVVEFDVEVEGLEAGCVSMNGIWGEGDCFESWLKGHNGEG